MTITDDEHYKRLNAVERVKLALAKHETGQPFEAKADDVQMLVDAYDRLRDPGQ